MLTVCQLPESRQHLPVSSDVVSSSGPGRDHEWMEIALINCPYQLTNDPETSTKACR
jgi:hypothetical protein